VQASAQRASRSTSAIDSAWSSVSLSGIEIRLIVEFAHRLIEDDAPRGGTICCPGSSSPDFNDFASNDYRMNQAISPVAFVVFLGWIAAALLATSRMWSDFIGEPVWRYQKLPPFLTS
jgi:hypothetical protein